MSTTNTTHGSSSTAWLGEMAAELTEKQLGNLNHLRRELAPQGATEHDQRQVDACLVGDAYGEVEHNRLQHRLSHIPLPDWAPDADDGWMLDNDGATRRGHTLLSFPAIHCTVPSARSGSYASVYAGGEEVAGSAPEFFVSIEAHGAALGRRAGTSVRGAAPRSGRQAGGGAGRGYGARLSVPYSDERPCPGVMGAGLFAVCPTVRGRYG